MNMVKGAMTIAKAARAAGVGVETVRYYERRGLIEKPPRGNAYRLYSEDTIRRIRFLRQAQALGFSLREAADLLAMRTDGDADVEAVRQRALAKLADIDRRLEDLHRLRSALGVVLAACPRQGPASRCSVIEAIDHGGDIVHSLTSPPTPGRTKPGEEDMETVVFDIEGMHCDGCARIIQTLLEKEQGVQVSTVSANGGQARVMFNPSAVPTGRLVEIIQRAGYRVTGESA